jgi:hypothetical protein
MKTQISNIDLVINLISNIKATNKNIKVAKEQKIEYYKGKIEQLNTFNQEQIKNHNFKSEILNASLTVQKLDYFYKYKFKLIDKLEIHNYSPEQNKLLFRKGEIFVSVPYKTDIDQAIIFIIENQTLEQIKTL